MKKEIYPRRGIGDLTFDMPVEQVVALIGKADEVECIDNAADVPTTVLHYEGLTLFCEGEDPLLSCVDINDADYQLFGKPVFDMNEQEIVRLMVANNYCEQDVDDEDWGERRITFGEGNIDFYFDEGDLMSIIIGK